MCGIVGVVQKNKAISPELILKMRDTFSHRGPDDAGVWINSDKSIGLGHRRLSIIDLSSAGHQPMSDEKGDIWITYNGEIYNFPQIKKELEAKGYIFKSHTDTEVVIYAYKEWGYDCLNRFNGMFAFAIYDDRNKKVFLARDRAGKKPLYYSECNGKFVFASEIKAILRDPEFPKEIDYTALNFYFTFGYIPFELSIFKYIRKLPPAHVMVYNTESCDYKIQRYWNIPEPDGRKYKEGELLDELEYLLEDAVRLRLISDVPLGAFLSGGVDSSMVVAMMSKVSSRSVKTFSIGFEEQKYNELPYARIVAEYFKTEHTELIVKSDAFGILPELVKHFDEPFADSSMIPTYYVSKLTKDYVTVALSGDGGDELFGGYSSYFGTLGNYYAAKFIPAFVRRLISGGAEILSDKFVGKRQLLRLRFNPQMAFIDRMSHSFFKDRYRKRLLNNEFLNVLGNEYGKPEKTVYDILINQNADFVNSLGITDFVSYLPEDILTKVDRMSMKVSLETRCPLLDYRVIEFAFRKVNGQYKIKHLLRKYLLKTLAKKILPKELDIKRKCGFGIPVAEWFRGELSGQVRDIILKDNIYFNKVYIEKLLDEHKTGIDHSARLYSLLVFCIWSDTVCKK
jgi:asparagine synthase (glutamine-hydrolysing)